MLVGAVAAALRRVCHSNTDMLNGSRPSSRDHANKPSPVNIPVSIITLIVLIKRMARAMVLVMTKQLLLGTFFTAMSTATVIP